MISKVAPIVALFVCVYDYGKVYVKSISFTKNIPNILSNSCVPLVRKKSESFTCLDMSSSYI